MVNTVVRPKGWNPTSSQCFVYCVKIFFGIILRITLGVSNTSPLDSFKNFCPNRRSCIMWRLLINIKMVKLIRLYSHPGTMISWEWNAPTKDVFVLACNFHSHQASTSAGVWRGLDLPLWITLAFLFPKKMHFCKSQQGLQGICGQHSLRIQALWPQALITEVHPINAPRPQALLHPKLLRWHLRPFKRGYYACVHPPLPTSFWVAIISRRYNY